MASLKLGFTVVALFVLSFAADSAEEDDADKILDASTFQRFRKFQSRFHVNCQNGTTDCKKRKRNFSANSKLLNDFNGNGKKSGYTIGENKFMDWSKDNMKKMFMNDKFVPNTPTKPIEAEELLHLRTKRAAGNFDWRSTGAVNPIRDQGGCGSCWAFAAVAAVEIQSNYKNNRTGTNRRSYSEQYLVDCSTTNGCSGYWPKTTMQYAQKTGLPRGAFYKYRGYEQTCPVINAVDYPIANVVDFTGAPYKMMQFLTNNGPVAACFFVCNDFMFYSGGVYTTDCKTSDATYLGGHAVTVIGYGTTADGIDYWLCRNQWGTGWGINGHFMIQRGLDLSSFESWEVSAPRAAIIP